MNKSTKDTIDRLRPIDDTFFHKLVEDLEFCEELLRIILDKSDLHIISSEPQKSLRNINGRSVIIDVLCVDDTGNYYNIEVQKDNNDNHIKRARYNASNIDTYISEKGSSFEELPDVYIIYISSFDVFQLGKTIYHIHSFIEETNTIIDNGYHEIFVNTYIDDGTDIAGLMQLFKQSNIPNDTRYPYICRKIRGFKEGKEQDTMCEVVEEYARNYALEYAKEYAVEYAKEYAVEYAKEQAKKSALLLIEQGFDNEFINHITNLDYDIIQELRDNISVQSS